MENSITPYHGTVWQGNTAPMFWSTFRSKYYKLSEFLPGAIQVNGADN